MSKSKKIYCFDLDGTICTQTGPGYYQDAEPIQEMVEAVRKLHKQGHVIKIFTARGMGTYKGALHEVYKNLYTLTKEQLEKWGVPFNELHMGKPNADYYIDDRLVSIDQIKNPNQ